MLDPRAIAAVGHPIRQAILDEFREHELTSPSEVAKRLDLPLNTVGYHFGRLANLGFLELARRERRRGATAHVYRLCERSNASEPDDDLLRSWFGPERSSRAELSVLLDEVALGELRVAVQSLYTHMRQLEEATVARTGGEGRTFTVHAGFDVQLLSAPAPPAGSRR